VFWIAILAVSCGLGLLARAWWTIAVMPATSVAFGAWIVADEPMNYDSRGSDIGSELSLP
jgi:hypothetical protein